MYIFRFVHIPDDGGTPSLLLGDTKIAGEGFEPTTSRVWASYATFTLSRVGEALNNIKLLLNYVLSADAPILF